MLLFLDIGTGELLLIILAGMLLFGTDKLPGILRGIAKGTDYIKKTSAEVREQISRETGLGDAIDDIRKTINKTTDDISAGFDPDFKNAANDNSDPSVQAESTARQSAEQHPGDKEKKPSQEHRSSENGTDNKA